MVSLLLHLSHGTYFTSRTVDITDIMYGFEHKSIKISRTQASVHVRSSGKKLKKEIPALALLDLKSL